MMNGADDLLTLLKKAVATQAISRRVRARLLKRCSDLYGFDLGSGDVDRLLSDLLEQGLPSAEAIEAVLRKLADAN